MKNLFGDLDELIEQAVASATGTEKSLQAKQTKAVKKRGLEAEVTQKEEVEEADDEDKGDESAEKIKGKPPEEKGKKKDTKDDAKKDDVQPGTKTSKKLADPPQKVIANPKFDDIKNKVNALRGSGSLADEKVAGSVKDYLSKLSSAEKGALLTYLTNLAQIMATVKSPKQVDDPSKVGIKTTFSGKKSKEKQRISPERSADDGVIVVGGK